jgi:hypothetical protein
MSRQVRRAKKFVHTRRFLLAAAIVVIVALAGLIGRSTFLASAATATVNGDASCGYSGTTQFTESTVMRWAQVNGNGLNSATFGAYANDENSTLLGVNTATAMPSSTSPQHVTGASGGDATQHDGITLTGSTLTGAAGTNEQPRPYYPALYITRLGGKPTGWSTPGNAIPAAQGDWQQGATPRNLNGGAPFVSDVFGDWVVGTQTNNPGPAPGPVGTLANGPLSTTLNTTHLDLQAALTKAVITGDAVTISTTGHTFSFVAAAPGAPVGASSIPVASKKSNFAFPTGSSINDTTAQTGNYARQASLPTQNTTSTNWNLAGGDAPVGTTFTSMGSEGYGTEFRWNVNQLSAFNPTTSAYENLQAGVFYKVQIVEHDGDQNKGGDSGEFCSVLQIPGPPPVHTSPVVGGVAGQANISEPLGKTINDQANVSDNAGFPNPTGNVTFKLFFVPLGDSTALSSACDTPHLVYTSPAVPLTVSSTLGNDSIASTAPSNGYNTTGHGLGTYVWQAFYDPNGDSNYTAAHEDCGVETDTMVTARIKLGPHDATNAVTTVHTVTATLETTTDNQTYTAVSGATINFTISGSSSGAGPNSHLKYDASGNGASCTTGAGGTCTTKIVDDIAETDTVSATAASGFSQSGVQGTFGSFSTTPVANSTCSLDANGASTCDALKHYDIGRILITPEDATNAAGTPHTLTATLQYSADGSAWTNAGSGQVITFSIQPPNGNIVFGAGGPFDNQCSTGAGGSCSVTISQTVAQAEQVGIRASSDFTVSSPVIGGTFHVATSANGLNATCDTGASGTAGNGTCDAVKHFIVARILLSPENATNIVGNKHTFTATLQTSSDGVTYTTISPGNGKTINFRILSSTPNNTAVFVDATHGLPNGLGQGTAGDGSQNGAVTCSTSAGSCGVDLNDSSADTNTIRANSVFTLSGIGGTFTVSTAASGCSADAGSANNGTCDATKIFVKPTTTEHVTDTMVGLPSDATGSVTYQAYTDQADCNNNVGNSNNTQVLVETDSITTPGTAPTSGSVDVPSGTSIWWRVTYNGSGGGNYGTFTSKCIETASSG